MINNNNNETIFKSRNMAWTKGKGSVQMFIESHTAYEKYESLNKYVLRCRLNVFTVAAFFTVSGSWFQ